MQTVQETEQLANREWGKGKLTEAKYEKYNQRIANAYQNASEQLASMKPQKRAKFLEKYNLGGTFDSNGYYIGQNTQKVGVNLNGNIVTNNLSQDTKNASMLKEKTANDVLDTKNKTPATAEAKFSIKKDANGNEYVNIDTDQHLFDGKNANEMRQIAGEVIRNRFQGQTIDNVAISKISRNEYLNSKSSQLSEKHYISTHRTKMRGATEIDNFIKSAKFVRHEDAKHPKYFNKDGYDIYQVDFMLNNELFTGEMLVAKNNGKDTFYDIVKIKSKGYQSDKIKTESHLPLDKKQEVIPPNGHSPNAVERNDSVNDGTITRLATEVTGNIVQSRTIDGDNSIKNSIRNNSQNVNKNSQKSEKNIIKNEKSSENEAKSVQNSTNKAKITPKNNDATPKQTVSKVEHTAEQAQNATAKYNRRAYSPRLWGKENNLVFKPTTKTLNAEQIEALDWFSSMDVHRNFADVVFTDELGARQNGAYSSGVIYISTKTKMPTKTALMHEMTHFIEGSKEYSNYARFVLDDLTSNDSILNKLNDISGNHWTVDEIVQAYTKQYGDKDASAVISEVVAIYTSEFMFTDNFRLQQLANRNKNLFQKIFNFIKSIGMAGMGVFMNRRGESLAELDKHNALAHARFRDGFNTDFGRIKSESGVLGKVDDVTDKLIAPMSVLDKWCNGAIWEACKHKTKGDLEQASELFNEVLIKTQANWSAVLSPQIMRSKNALIKFATMYMSEPLQLLTRLYASTAKYQTLRKIMKSEKYRTDAEFAKKIDAQLKEARANLRIQVTNVVGGMAIVTMISVAIKELLRTAGDDDEKKWQDRILPEFTSQVFGMFPIVRDMYSALQGYDITNSAYTGLQNIVNAGSNLAELATMLINGQQYDATDMNKIIRQTVLGLSQTFGIPVRSAEKVCRCWSRS